MKNTILIFLFILTGFQLLAQNASTANDLVSYSTIHSIGFEWNLTGDDNHNANCQVRYRKEGASEWNNALDLFRVDFNGANMLAGSIMFLDEATSYQVELSLTDPDGGGTSQIVVLSTRATPQHPTSGTTYYVSPGSGGGTGSSSDPFLGIDAAQATANAGDIFILNSGNYGGRMRFTQSGTINNYIVWKAADGAIPVFEGARMIGDFIWLQGITIENVDYGLLTETGFEPDGIAITECRFNDFLYAIQINHGGKNWYITDNVFVGRISDISTGNFSGEAVELEHTSGHVVAYNSISQTADGVSYPHQNCDIYRNEIFNVSDDGIEFDYGYANNRAWENRITNANNNGISFQPMNGAPAYVVRNQVIVHQEDVLKLRTQVDRVLLANNTLVCWSGPVSIGVDLMLGFQSNNNLWISATDRYIWEDNSTGTVADWRTNLDYDGFDWASATYGFKWSNTRLNTLADFQAASGQELHGIRVNKSEIFESFNMPAPPSLSAIQYLKLKNGCNAIDAGIILNNINESFTGTAPDLGAFEYGLEVPRYGPREGTTTNVLNIPKGKKLTTKAYPNPFKNSTIISYTVEQNSRVQLNIYDISGKKISSLIDELQKADDYEIKFESKNLPSGIYFYELKVNDLLKRKKLLIQK